MRCYVISRGIGVSNTLVYEPILYGDHVSKIVGCFAHILSPLLVSPQCTLNDVPLGLRISRSRRTPIEYGQHLLRIVSTILLRSMLQLDLMGYYCLSWRSDV